MGKGTHVRTPSYLGVSVHFGAGLARRIGQVMAEHGLPAGPGPVLVCAGVSPKPWLGDVLQSVRGAGNPVRLHPVAAYPTCDAIDAALAVARALSPGTIVAVGGGSVIDTAKVVALLARSSLSASQAISGLPPDPDPVALVAVPTTSGSGAEMTSTATVWDWQARRKLSIAHAAMAPSLSVVDPCLSASAPPEVQASAALDALAQAMESAWAVAAVRESACCALDAVATLVAAMRRAPGWPAPDSALLEIGRASMLAGMAIARTRTTLCHALSYPLTSSYGIPHGLACAVTLADVMAFNAAVEDESCAHPSGTSAVRAALDGLASAIGQPSVSDAARVIGGIVRQSARLYADSWDVPSPRVVAQESVSYDRAGNNPRNCEVADAARIVRSSFLALRD